MAVGHLTGLYCFLVKRFTIEVMMQQSTIFWGLYNDTGKAWTEKKGNSLVYHVKDYPDLPEAIRHTVTGYVGSVLDQAKKQYVDISHDGSDPEDWKWIVI
jgi:hypothetical protein